LQITLVIAGTKIGETKSEYIMDVFNKVFPMHDALAALKNICFSFIDTTGYTLPYLG
jgi:hypothetical protein